MRHFELNDFLHPDQCLCEQSSLTVFLANASGAERSAWAERLASFLTLLPPGEDGGKDSAFVLGNLAGAAAHWGLAVRCFEQSLSSCGEHAATLFNLAVAQQQRGRGEQARRHLLRAIEIAPDCLLYQEQLTALDARSALERAALPVVPGRPSGLSLGLLAPYHAAPLQRYLGDPAVAVAVGLPVLSNLPLARAWIQAQQQAAVSTGLLPLALLHEEHGLVGGAALHSPSAAGQCAFYYWIGRDFQKQGWGGIFIALLSRLAAARGAHWLGSFVSINNIRSARVLCRSGFQADPPAGAGFWRKPLATNREELHAHNA